MPSKLRGWRDFERLPASLSEATTRRSDGRLYGTLGLPTENGRRRPRCRGALHASISAIKLKGSRPPVPSQQTLSVTPRLDPLFPAHHKLSRQAAKPIL